MWFGLDTIRKRTIGSISCENTCILMQTKQLCAKVFHSRLNPCEIYCAHKIEWIAYVRALLNELTAYIQMEMVLYIT